MPSSYVALAIATPLAIMGFLGGATIIETVSTQATLQTVANIVAQSVVDNGCLTTAALQALDHTLIAAHLNPQQVTLQAQTGTAASYGASELTVVVGYHLPLAIPGTPWVLTRRYVTATVSGLQSQYVPNVAGPAGCAQAGQVSAIFPGSSGSGATTTGLTGPSVPTAITETLAPSAPTVGSSLTVSGVVTSDGTPVANTDVSVLLGSQAAVTVATNAQGQYQATVTPSQAGAVTVSVMAGPAVNQATTTIQPLSGMTIHWQTPASVEAGQAFVVQGTVLAADGQPVPDGTIVTISSSDPAAIPTQSVTTVAGSFTVSVPQGVATPGTVTVTGHTGNITQSTTITVQPGAPQSVALAITPTSGRAGSSWTVSGTVYGPDHTPVGAGVPVTLTSSTDVRDTLPSFTTNASGQFQGTMTLTVAGSQTFTAQAGVAQSEPVTVTVAPGSPTQVLDMQATPTVVGVHQATVISGTVADAYGNPVGAGIPVTLTSTAWTQPVTTTTGSGGTFHASVSFAQAGTQLVQAAVGSTSLQNGSVAVTVTP